MSPELARSPFFIAAVTLAIFGAILILSGISALIRARLLRFSLRTLSGLLLLALGLATGAMAAGIQGYQALTREETAAYITVRPAGRQHFEATFRFPDKRQATFELAGDEIYIDAHILKWKPYANILGLHTLYQLDRVTGRYHDITEERSAPRTVYSLGQDTPVDLFSLRRRHLFFAPLFDAEYGSAVFVPATQPARLELRVSTTGLLMRDTTPDSR